jgi:pyrroloquinoline quinone biosynthesis protein B
MARLSVAAGALVGWLAVALGGCAAPAAPATAETPAVPFVRVLGTVQDGGLPHAACEHEGCRRVREGLAPERWISSLAIVLPQSHEVFLVDATPDIRPQLDLLRDVRRPPTDRVDRSPLSGVFLTHAHIGHYLGLAFLGFEAVNTRGLPVFATPRMAGFLRANGPWSQLVTMGNVELRELALDSPVHLSPEVSVTPFSVPHRDEYSDTVGYLVRGPARTLLFVPDTDKWATWQPSLLERLEGVDVALLDGTFYSADELPGRSVEEIGHPLIGSTMDLLERRVEAGGPEVLFIHLNHSNPALTAGSSAARSIAARGFAVAREGQEFPLG